MKRFLFLIFVIMVIFLTTNIKATTIYTDQINFQPGESRIHNQVVNADTNANITVIVDPAFMYITSNPVAIIQDNNLSWQNAISVTFSISSPNNCVEGTVYRMNVLVDDILTKTFTFLCIPDIKVVDYKAEYGHGDSNYLPGSYRFIPANTTISLFNLIRVYTYGSYFNPNEDGYNATITCYFPPYLVKERQHNDGTNVIQGNTQVNATFYWTSLFGNWFRIAPLEQDINSLNVGETYNVTCEQLTYQYSTGTMRANFTPVSFQARSITPFNVTITTDISNNGLVYSVQNIELYPIYDIEFLWKTDNDDATYENLKQLLPGEKIGFEVFLEGNGNLSFLPSFVAVWQKSSLKPFRYTQGFSAPFNFSGTEGKINRIANVADILNGGVQWHITDIEQIHAGRDYKVEVTVNDLAGNAVVPSSIVAKITDSVGNIIVNNLPLTLVHAGVYAYTFTTPTTGNMGEWRTEVHAIYNSKDIYLYDVWRLSNAPATVSITINTVCDDKVTATISIKNEGSDATEFTYSYWTTISPTGDIGTAYDSGTASKLIPAGDTFIVQKTLLWDQMANNSYFRVSAGADDFAYAIKIFDVISYPCIALNTGTGDSSNELLTNKGGGTLAPETIVVTPTTATVVNKFSLFSTNSRNIWIWSIAASLTVLAIYFIFYWWRARKLKSNMYRRLKGKPFRDVMPPLPPEYENG